MKTRSLAVLRQTEGSSALEFAIVAPVLMLMIFGIVQLGVMFMADAGLRHAVDEAARHATIFPTPADPDIIARATDSKFGLKLDRITGPTVRRVEVGNVKYAEVTMNYAMPVDFVFFKGPDIVLSRTRIAYYP